MPGTRVLGEFGNDPDRYTSAKTRKNHAGTSPLTTASSRKHAMLARHTRNRRPYDAINAWAFRTINTNPRAHAYYDHRHAASDLHHQALPTQGNQLVGTLHSCLKPTTIYHEHTAQAHHTHNHQTTA